MTQKFHKLITRPNNDIKRIRKSVLMFFYCTFKTSIYTTKICKDVKKKLYIYYQSNRELNLIHKASNTKAPTTVFLIQKHNLKVNVKIERSYSF
jgi:hypothetical protein